MSVRNLLILSLAFPFASSLRAMPQESLAHLDAPLVVADERQRFSVVLDLDGDGWQDALSWWYGNSSGSLLKVSGWINDHTGALHLAWTSSISGPGQLNPVHMGLCDMNRDGRDDFYLFYNGSSTGTIRSFTSNGSLAPTPFYWLDTGALLHGCVLGDYDQDGFTDVAYVEGLFLKIMKFWVNEQGQLLYTQTSGTLVSAVPEAMIGIDANGDATPDLCLNIGPRAWIVPVINGVTQTPLVLAHGIVHMPMLTAGDIDNDGDQDVVVFGMSDYAVLRRTGPASYSVEPIRIGGPAIQLADVNGDGFLDGICCGGGGDGSPPPDNRTLSRLRVSLNDTTGHFASAFETSWLGSDEIAGAADLDHDGDLDLIAGRCVYYPHGPVTRPITPQVGNTAALPRSCFDFDRDGDPDFDCGTASFKRNAGDGSTGSFTPVCAPAPAGMTFKGPGLPGDFDGDGDVDLLVSMYQGTTFVSMRFLSNNGGGGFVDMGDAGAAGVDFNGSPVEADRADRSLAADLDDDGDLDLMTFALSAPWLTRSWINDGTAHFVAGPGFGFNIPQFVGDLNQDGLPDIVTMDGADVAAFYSLSPGVFGPKSGLASAHSYPPGDRTLVADLDGDGDLDILYPWKPGTLDATVSLLRNTGSGFVNEGTLIGSLDTTAFQPLLIQAVDLDGDGRLDVIAGPVAKDKNAAFVRMRKQDNSGYEPAVKQIIYRNDGTDVFYGQGVCTDVDGDGDVDLVTDQVIRNAISTPPLSGARRQTGNGQAGSGGMTPTLGATGPFQIGSAIYLRITGAAPRSSGLLTIGRAYEAPPPFNGGTVHQGIHSTLLTTVPFMTGGASGLAGSGDWTLLLHVPAAVVGQTHYYRAVLNDPGAPYGQSVTNKLFLTFGP